MFRLAAPSAHCIEIRHVALAMFILPLQECGYASRRAMRDTPAGVYAMRVPFSRYAFTLCQYASALMRHRARCCSDIILMARERLSGVDEIEI